MAFDHINGCSSCSVLGRQLLNKTFSMTLIANNSMTSATKAIELAYAQMTGSWQTAGFPNTETCSKSTGSGRVIGIIGEASSGECIRSQSCSQSISASRGAGVSETVAL